MERYSDTAIEIINDLHTERMDYQSEYLPLIDAANQLAAYESTGIEPERVAEIVSIIGNDYDLGRLRKLVEADREGRCMILPAKLGTRLFVRCKDGDSPVVVESTVVGAHVKDTESYRGAPRKEYIVVRSNGFSKHISVDRIGKTAFFSREEALDGKKAALAERKEN